MKSQSLKFHLLFFVFAFLAMVHGANTPLSGQSLDNTEVPGKLSSIGRHGEPEKIELPNGNYKMVYKNKANETVKVDEFEVVGSVMRVTKLVKTTTAVASVNDKNGIRIEVKTFEDSDTTMTGVRMKGHSTLVYEEGILREKIVHTVKDGDTSYETRTITRYEPGGDPKGVTQREKRDVNRKWVKDSAFTGKWYVTKDGRRQPGEYTFLESPSLVTIQHNAQTFLLMLNARSDTRTVVLPASSNDHLKFTGRLIQLRGNADEGRMEFWLTRDLTLSGFEKSSFALVREDN